MAINDRTLFHFDSQRKAWAVVVLLGTGATAFPIGLAVVLSILGHATWHLYRKVIE